MTSILYLSIDGLTDPLGQAQVIPYLAGLAAKGHSITILSCEKKENFSKNHAGVAASLSRANIRWVHTPYRKSIPLLSQRGNLYRLKKMAVAEAKKQPVGLIVHCRSYLPALIGLHLQKKFKAKFIFDMRGFWADERIEGKTWKLSNPLHKRAYRYFKKKELEFINNANHIVTLTRDAADIINIMQHPGKNNYTVIPCCADLEHFKISTPTQAIQARQQLGISPNSFVLGYLGSLGTWYMLPEMLDQFKVLLTKLPHSLFFFVTGDDPSLIQTAAKQKNIPAKNILVKSASRKQVPEFISTFNAGIYFIRPTFSKRGSSPTKMAELLACGKPIITNIGIGDSDELITQEKCGLLLPAFSNKEYLQLAEKLDRLHNLNGQDLRRSAETNFSLTEGVNRYDRIYRALSGA